MKSKKKGLKIITVFFVAFFIGLLTYLGNTYLADKTAHEALISNSQVTIEETLELTLFKPKGKSSEIGFIFYPGGKVQSIAYAPIMRSLAEKGMTTLSVKMPFNLAIFDVDAAKKAMESLPKVKKWIIGGHSLGGVMAGNYSVNHSKNLVGLVFMGAYPNKILVPQIPVLSFYGSEDKVLNKEAFEASKIKMPENAKYYEIIGGNHANYGNYGTQKGDGIALISSQEQQKIVVDAIAETFLKKES